MTRTPTPFVAGILALSLALPCSAQIYPSNGYIGLFQDAAGTQCCTTAMPNALTTLYVVAVIGGATAGGITGVEFRFVFSPASAQSSYFVSFSPDPGVVVSIGTPIDPTPENPSDGYGSNLAYSTCQGATSGDRVHLGTLTTFNFGSGQPADVLTTRRLPPTYPPARDCPLMVLCDAPVFTSICLTVQTPQLPAGEEPINFRSTLNKPCDVPMCGRVGVSPATWTAVKGLFR